MCKALEGITIIDFSQLLAGPFATMMLADMGADVIKVERVNDGDGMRKITFFNEFLKGNNSPCFMAWNRNKRSIAVDMKNPEVKKILLDMIKKADVVVENFRPGVMERLGYGYEDLKKINPSLVYASNTGYGDSGPYASRPGQDMLIQGLTGLMNLTGRKNSSPMPLGTGLPDMLSSFHLVYGILAALLYAKNTGKGQHVNVDLMRSTLALESQEFMTLLNLPVQYERPNSGIGHSFQQAPFGVYECSDGFISIAMSPYKTLVQALEVPELLCYEDEQIRYDKRDEVFYAIEEITKKNTVAYWIDRMLSFDIWVAPVKDIKEVPEDPQVIHMEAITQFHHAEAGDLKCVAPAVTMSETPAIIDKAPPMIGEHSREILIEYGVDKEIINKLFEDNAVSQNN